MRLLVGYAAGGATDIVARLIARWLSERLGQQFIVENRPGAASNIATEQVVRASPDGYTLLMASAANAINATLYNRLNFDFIRDTEAIAGVIRMQNVLEVNSAVPVNTVPELIAYARINPERLIAGSAGNGSPGHVSGELFKMMTGVKMLHVPYRGIAPALTDLLAGQIHLLFDNMATAIELIRTRKVRALAVTTAHRSPLLPELPAIAEFVPGYEASSWYGISAPKGTPLEIVEVLSREINAALANNKIGERFFAIGGSPLGGLPADFHNLMVQETDKWRSVVWFSNANEK
ncbi:MAG TPA: tripartite tricarboxylate transporter substrate binding protein [Gammaproteobacteria bacterium]|nr:tripartite tricarboxylate transporter substrate binding protein [Gammaproteobacteria bacterium]